ncbi:hypothetical protein [Streptacidiphilus sp. EB129]|uniref:hypothetical protein n=1 Tax=Streptacidiphilus sp. EB129 TaxID=3156262 RepID=UPI003516C5BE
MSTALGATALALAALATASGVVANGPTDDLCTRQPVACGLVTNLLSSMIVAAVVSLIWFGTVTRRLVLRAYLRRVRRNPRLLLGERASGTVGDDFMEPPGLLSALETELRFGRIGTPLVVTGPAGAGKSLVLSRLAGRLAAHGVIPVLISLTGTPLDENVDDAARVSFLRQVERDTTRESDGEKLWWRIRRQRRVVILLDSLDEMWSDTGYLDIRGAVTALLADVAGSDFGLVVAARPESLPRVVPGYRFPVTGVPVSCVVEKLATWGVAAATAEELTRAAALHEIPLFAVLAKELPPSDVVRIAHMRTTVLRCRAELLRSVMNHRLEQVSAPEEFLSVLSSMAWLQLSTGHRPVTLDDYAADPRTGPMGRQSTDRSEIRKVMQAAQEAGFLRPGSDPAQILFSHPVLLSYAASLGVVEALADRRGRAQLKRLLSGTVLGEAVLAIELAFARTSALASARELVKIVVALPDNAPLARNLQGANMIASVASSLEDARLQRKALTLYQRLWHSSEPIDRAEAVPYIDRLTLQSRGAFLWSVLDGDDQYTTRWACAQRLGDPDEGRYADVADLVDGFIQRIRSGSHNAGSDVVERAFWFVPSLADGLPQGPNGTRGRTQLVQLKACLEQLRTTGVPGVLGAESSLAQGYKAAAFRCPGIRPDPGACELLQSADFWYARLEALQAVGRRLASNPVDPAAEAAVRTRLTDPHPYVRGMAGLVLRCRDEPWERLLWSSEENLNQSAVAALDPEALQLLGEVTLLLNHNEKAPQAQRDANSRRDALPLCLERHEQRPRLTSTGGCPPHCGFGLCPFSTSATGRHSRDLLNEAVCRSIRQATMSIGTPIWYDSSQRKGYLAIWRELESFYQTRPR